MNVLNLLLKNSQSLLFSTFSKRERERERSRFYKRRGCENNSIFYEDESLNNSNKQIDEQVLS